MVLPRLRTIPGLDIDTGLALTNDRAALYLNLLRRFCSCPVAKESGLRQAFDAGDAHTAEREAHTLKGIAAQIGARIIDPGGTIDRAFTPAGLQQRSRSRYRRTA